MENDSSKHITPLNLDYPIWEQVLTVHPLVIVGSVDQKGDIDFAPKHMAFPLGWKNYYGFVCTPNHTTYQNIKETGEFTVTFPAPEQVVLTSMTASPRCDDNTKPALSTLSKIRAKKVNGFFIENGYLFLECKLLRIIDGFGENSLILGEVIVASAKRGIMKLPSVDENETIYHNPQLVYVSPGRYAVIKNTHAFPFPENFKK